MLSELTEYFGAASPETVAAYLFGSHAAGLTHSDSDVDVGVLFDDRVLGDRHARAEAAAQLTTALIHVVRCNRVDVVALNDAPAGFVAAILRSGQRVMCRDAEADHAFTRRMLLRAADLRPFLDRTRRLKLAYALR